MKNRTDFGTWLHLHHETMLSTFFFAHRSDGELDSYEVYGMKEIKSM